MISDPVDGLMQIFNVIQDATITTITRYIHVSYHRDLFLRPVTRSAPFFLWETRGVTNHVASSNRRSCISFDGYRALELDGDVNFRYYSAISKMSIFNRVVEVFRSKMKSKMETHIEPVRVIIVPRSHLLLVFLWGNEKFTWIEWDSIFKKSVRQNRWNFKKEVAEVTRSFFTDRLKWNCGIRETLTRDHLTIDM